MSKSKLYFLQLDFDHPLNNLFFSSCLLLSKKNYSKNSTSRKPNSKNNFFPKVRNEGENSDFRSQILTLEQISAIGEIKSNE